MWRQVKLRYERPFDCGWHLRNNFDHGNKPASAQGAFSRVVPLHQCQSVTNPWLIQ